MAEIKNILTATDVSDSSSQAIARGFLLAQVSGARFTIIHAVGIDALSPLRELLGDNADDVSQKILDEASERLAEFVADSPMKDGIPVNIHIERGLVGTL